MAAALISIIGPPAAGKTTLAEWLAGRLPARMLREDYAGNPFLAASYMGQAELALPAQLYFLFSRITQLRAGDWPEDGIAVSDYGFCQDAIYTAGNLTGADLGVYHRLARPAAKVVKTPDLLIHLDGPERLLLERVSRRGRPHEATFDEPFLRRLRGEYEAAATLAKCPVLAIDVGKVNLMDETACKELLARVRETLE